MEKLSSENIGVLVQPNPAYIKALVQKELIPTQKKFMAAALNYHNILVNELI